MVSAWVKLTPVDPHTGEPKQNSGQCLTFIKHVKGVSVTSHKYGSEITQVFSVAFKRKSEGGLNFFARTEEVQSCESSFVVREKPKVAQAELDEKCAQAKLADRFGFKIK